MRKVSAAIEYILNAPSDAACIFRCAIAALAGALATEAIHAILRRIKGVEK